MSCTLTNVGSRGEQGAIEEIVTQLDRAHQALARALDGPLCDDDIDALVPWNATAATSTPPK